MSDTPLLMVSNRDYTLHTTKGHTVAFKRGVERLVPRAVVKDAMAVGIIPVDDVESIQSGGDAAPSAPQMTPAEEDELIKEAMLMMMERNSGDDFTAGNKPQVSVLKRETGIEEIDAERRDELWEQVLAEATS